MKSKAIAFVLLLLIAASLSAQDKVPAFPGAHGFGKYATGGRGGKIYIVTNLHDEGPGSLREAIRKKGPRTILFAVSGNIKLKSRLTIRHGDVTIAGQSAPGDGICIQDNAVSIQANNVIIRFMRFRLGDRSGIESDAFSGNRYAENVIIDHCSISWATDECASFYNNRNFTMQWCIVSESLNESTHSKGEHGYGGIWGGMNASFHHNLLAHHTSRLPRFSGSSTTPNTPAELVDFRNNVIYNWESNNTYGGERGKYNVVNNYYKPGPASKPKNVWMLNPSSPYGTFYVDGNIYHDNKAITNNNWTGVKVADVDSVRVRNPFEVQPIPPQSAGQAFVEVLEHAGASLRRDTVDRRIVEEVRRGEASFGKKRDGIIDSQQDVGGWPLLQSSTTPLDTDRDGLPDDWEKKNKLDSTNPTDASTLSPNSHYTNLEIYLNEKVNHLYK